jgi:predicted PurR-regulated permease PerM
MPNVVKDFLAWIKTLEQGDTSHELITLITQLTTTISAKVEQFLSNDLLPNMQTLLTEMTSSFLNLFTLAKNFGIGCIVAIYLLSGKEKFLAQAKLVLYSIFSQKWGDRILDELHYTDQMFSGFITAKLLDSAIIGGICFVFCYLVRMPYAMLVSIIVGVTNMIPFFGPYLGAIPSAFLILMESPSKCVLFLIFIIILQQIDGNVIGPRILGDKMGVSGFWVLFAILFFGSIWGLVGMLIGVPVFAVIYDLLRKLIFRGLRQNNQSTMIEQYETQYPRETKKK